MNDFLIPNLLFHALRVTEKAAIAAHSHLGRGDEKVADKLAVDAMREALNKMPIHGRIVIGEGERDEAPMLYIGEEVGANQGPKIDIAVDPLEGTTILATGRNNALAVAAFSEEGGFLHAPDVYMDKIAIGHANVQIVDLDNSVEENLNNLAQFLNKPISELVVMILDRPRHQQLINEVRALGARIKLINDGDVSAVIQTAIPGSGVDIYLGSGGAPEGVLAAAALAALGGFMSTRLLFRNEDEKSRAHKMGIADFDRKYYLKDLVQKEVIFAATGVTDGDLLKGVRHTPGKIQTHSLIMHSSIMHSSSKTLSYMKNIHLI